MEGKKVSEEFSGFRERCKENIRDREDMPEIAKDGDLRTVFEKEEDAVREMIREYV